MRVRAPCSVRYDLPNWVSRFIQHSAFDAETKKCFSAMMSGTLAPGQETDLHIFDVTTMKTRLALTIQVPSPCQSASIDMFLIYRTDIFV